MNIILTRGREDKYNREFFGQDSSRTGMSASVAPTHKSTEQIRAPETVPKAVEHSSSDEPSECKSKANEN